jgi:plastocyanin
MEQGVRKRTLRGRRFLGAFVLAGALVAIPGASQSATFAVKATDGKDWKPASLTVARGSKVVWKNPTGATHNVTAYKGSWSKSTTLESGEHTSKTFRRSGTYKYRCTIHSSIENGKCDGMCGKIRVN